MKLPIWLCGLLGHEWEAKIHDGHVYMVCSRCECVHPSSILEGMDRAIRGRD